MLMLCLQTKAQKVVEFYCEFELLEKTKNNINQSPSGTLGMAVLFYNSYRIKDIFL